MALGSVLTYGAEKYDVRDWEQGNDWGKYVAALMRHLCKWMGGEDVDPESGLHHMDHVLCNAAILVTYIKRGVGVDSRRYKS